jgi:hypothetical protein
MELANRCGRRLCVEEPAAGTVVMGWQFLGQIMQYSSGPASLLLLSCPHTWSYTKDDWNSSAT